jgi:ribonuclease P protein component
MIVLWRESATARRAGFAVSRHVRTAVERNRARRRLRAAYRAARHAAPAQAMLVVIGKPAVLREPFRTLTDEMRAALAAIPGARG